MLGYYQWLQHGRKSLEHGCVELVDVFQANWFYNISRTHLKAAHHGSSSDEQVCTKATVCQLPWNDINDRVSIRPWPWRCAFMPQNFFCRTGTYKTHVKNPRMKQLRVWSNLHKGHKIWLSDCQSLKQGIVSIRLCSSFGSLSSSWWHSHGRGRRFLQSTALENF